MIINRLNSLYGIKKSLVRSILKQELPERFKQTKKDFNDYDELY
jgi:hypothetical protein